MCPASPPRIKAHREPVVLALEALGQGGLSVGHAEEEQLRHEQYRAGVLLAAVTGATRPRAQQRTWSTPRTRAGTDYLRDRRESCKVRAEVSIHCAQCTLKRRHREEGQQRRGQMWEQRTLRRCSDKKSSVRGYATVLLCTSRSARSRVESPRLAPMTRLSEWEHRTALAGLALSAGSPRIVASALGQLERLWRRPVPVILAFAEGLQPRQRRRQRARRTA